MRTNTDTRRLVRAPPHQRPNHVVALIHPKKPQPHSFASFSVPLKFNKLDLRDYLYHVYDVEVKSVRSMVLPTRPQQRIMEGMSDGLRVAGSWYRPQPKKIKMVELVKPFVPPEKPKDLTPWDQALYERVRGEQEKRFGKPDMTRKDLAELRKRRKQKNNPPRNHKNKTTKEVQDLAAGKAKWTNGAVLDEKWTEMQRIEEAARDEK